LRAQAQLRILAGVGQEPPMHRSVCLALAALAAGAAPAFAFSAKFSWSGIGACGSTSPAFAILGAPKGATQLRFAMRDHDAPNYNHGGSTVAYSGKGGVPQGAISYVGPCPPPGQTHRYVWTIEALDPAGKSLATTQAEGRFPAR